MYSKKIQNGSDGHCSIEDAKACMELVQLKIKNGKFVYFIFTKEQISDSALCVRRVENPSFRAGVVLYYANSARKLVTFPHSNAYSLPHRIILSNRNATRRNVEVLNGHQEVGWVWIAKIDRGPGARSLEAIIFQTEWPSYSRGGQSIATATSIRDLEETRKIIQNSFDELINYCRTLKNPHPLRKE